MYYANKQEIMAYSYDAVRELKDAGYSKIDILNLLKSKLVSTTPSVVFNKYKTHSINYEQASNYLMLKPKNFAEFSSRFRGEM